MAAKPGWICLRRAPPASQVCGYVGLGVCEFSLTHSRTHTLTNNHASYFLFFSQDSVIKALKWCRRPAMKDYSVRISWMSFHESDRMTAVSEASVASITACFRF